MIWPMQKRTFLTTVVAAAAVVLAGCNSEPEVSPEEQDRTFTSALVADGFDPEEAEILLPVGQLVCPNIGYGRTDQELISFIAGDVWGPADAAAVIAAAKLAYCPD